MTVNSLKDPSGGTGSATASYGANNIDASADPRYFGFENAAGEWYILKMASGDEILTYAKGASGYAAAWTARASQSYDTYGNTF